MSNSTSFESRYRSFIDGHLVAEISNTYAEGGDLNTFGVQIVGLPVLRAETFEDALEWLKAITRVTEKALAYEEIFEYEENPDPDGICGGFIEDDDQTLIVDLDSVDELTDEDAADEWADEDDDHYRYIDGEWHISFGNGRRPWRPIKDDDQDFLTDYGPYRKVGK